MNIRFENMRYILRLSFVLLIYLSFYFTAKCNDTIKYRNQHLISVHTGFANQMNNDGVMSPFLYKGGSIPFGIGYDFLNRRSHQTFSATFLNVKLKSEIPNYSNVGLIHNVQSTSIDIRYSYLRIISRFSNNTKLFIGGEYNGFINLRNHYYTAYNNYLMSDCFNSILLKAKVIKNFESEKSNLSFNFSIPIVSYVLMRETYNPYVGEKIESLDLSKNVLKQLLRDGDIVSFSKLTGVRADLNYIHYLGDHFGLNLKYCFYYYKFTQYDNLFYSKNLYNQILGGILIKF
jgi:hypothetical protein